MDPNDRLSRLSQEERALLFERLRRRKGEETTIPRRSLPAPPPLSFAQQRLWFLDRLMPGDPSYNIPFGARIEGPLDAGALGRALDAIAARHESLRTTIGAVDGNPVQLIAPPLSLPLPVVDLEGLARLEGLEREADRLWDAVIGLPFNLAAGPLLRAVLIRLARERHVLVLVLHHIVGDGWSLGVVVRELTALYRAMPLPELPIQYADFAVWQREWLSGERLEAQLAVWRRRLAGLPPSLALPTDHPRPPVKTSAGASRWLEFPPGCATRLQAVAREEGATPFMLLLAVWQTLLCRYTGQEDLAVGSVVANRNRPELKNLIGFFVNTLVLRGDLTGDPPFRELLGRLREVALEAFAHQDVPFEKLVEELRPERDPSRSPIFQVSVSLQNTPPADADFGREVRLEFLARSTGRVKFDLEASFEPDTKGVLRGALSYSSDLFDAATADRMARHLETLLAAALDDRSHRLSEMPLLTAEEQRQLAAWNRTEERWPRLSTLAEKVGEHAAARPGAAAVVAGGRALTYGELDQRANRLAHLLRRLGAGPEVAVGVLLPRSPELALAALAVARAGAAYLPLDPAYPDERIAGTLDDAGAPLVLTLAELAGRLSSGGRTVLRLDALDDLGDREMPAGSPPPLGFPESLAYIIYTSGSTGRPKGVGVPRSSLANLIAWHLRDLPVRPGERATLAAGPAFDGSVWELWAFLAAGAEIHVLDDEIRLAPPRLAAWLARERIACSFLPTPLAEALLAEPAAAAVPLRLLLTGGDRLHRIARRDLPFSIANCYGPSEATVVTTFEPAAEQEEERDPSIGLPIANARVYVLDPRLRRLPAGVPGELWVGGEILARGYLHRPDLTAAAWRPDPFAGLPGARMYRTGDLVRRRPDGRLEVLGRIDTQVKVRGFRIELGEIEAALHDQPGVSQAVVLVRGADRRLTAYLVAAPGVCGSDAELRSALRRRLPELMVPSAFVRLAELPLTPGGKVDRQALARLAPPPAAEREVAEPRSETERRLAAIWAEVLGCDRVGASDSFFDLGGHSLLLTRVQARLADDLGREVPLLKLVEHPTVRALAAWLERNAPAAADGAPEPGEASRDRARRQREALAAQRQRLAQRGAR